MATSARPAGATGSGDKEFDVVVWGATGFVGKLVCERLAYKYQGEVKWAMAGRSQEKLEGVRDSCAALNGVAKDTTILLGDLKDPASLAAIARRTKVIMAMAGPYAKYGEPIVQACVQEGAHYVDITGETWFIRDMIDKYHDKAEERRVRIVTCCGYDSIPSDMGTFFLASYVNEKLGKKLSDVRMLMVGGAGGVSGGTIDSLFNPEVSSDQYKTAKHPYCLNPPDQRTGRDGSDQAGVGWVPELEKRTFPFVMQPINSRVVRRSNALLDNRYGQGMKYNEAAVAPSPSVVTAPLITAIMGLGMGLLMSPVGPFLRRKLLPAAGDGPSTETQENNYWRHLYLGTIAGDEVATVQATGYGKGDPGYGSTHRMVLEAALALALNLDECEATGCLKGGILTPAAAAGPVLLRRLKENAEVTFEISSKVGDCGTTDAEKLVADDNSQRYSRL